MKARKAIVIYDDDSAMTLLKPISEEYNNQLLVIYEDAYGEAVLETIAGFDIKLLREKPKVRLLKDLDEEADG